MDPSRNPLFSATLGLALLPLAAFLMGALQETRSLTEAQTPAPSPAHRGEPRAQSIRGLEFGLTLDRVWRDRFLGRLDEASARLGPLLRGRSPSLGSRRQLLRLNGEAYALLSASPWTQASAQFGGLQTRWQGGASPPPEPSLGQALFIEPWSRSLSVDRLLTLADLEGGLTSPASERRARVEAVAGLFEANLKSMRLALRWTRGKSGPGISLAGARSYVAAQVYLADREEAAEAQRTIVEFTRRSRGEPEFDDLVLLGRLLQDDWRGREALQEAVGRPELATLSLDRACRIHTWLLREEILGRVEDPEALARHFHRLSTLSGTVGRLDWRMVMDVVSLALAIVDRPWTGKEVRRWAKEYAKLVRDWVPGDCDEAAGPVDGPLCSRVAPILYEPPPTPSTPPEARWRRCMREPCVGPERVER